VWKGAAPPPPGTGDESNDSSSLPPGYPEGKPQLAGVVPSCAAVGPPSEPQCPSLPPPVVPALRVRPVHRPFASPAPRRSRRGQVDPRPPAPRLQRRVSAVATPSAASRLLGGLLPLLLLLHVASELGAGYSSNSFGDGSPKKPAGFPGQRRISQWLSQSPEVLFPQLAPVLQTAPPPASSPHPALFETLPPAVAPCLAGLPARVFEGRHAPESGSVPHGGGVVLAAL
jgi:hypothetical protein